jgi:hypothetical protein
MTTGPLAKPKELVVKLLVTGGAGYIGGVLRFADDLMEEVLDRDPNLALAADLRSTLP